jgi:hypothetical protein
VEPPATVVPTAVLPAPRSGQRQARHVRRTSTGRGALRVALDLGPLLVGGAILATVTLLLIVSIFV